MFVRIKHFHVNLVPLFGVLIKIPCSIYSNNCPLRSISCPSVLVNIILLYTRHYLPEKFQMFSDLSTDKGIECTWGESLFIYLFKTLTMTVQKLPS